MEGPLLLPPDPPYLSLSPALSAPLESWNTPKSESTKALSRSKSVEGDARPSLLGSVLIVGLSCGAMNVLSCTTHMMKHFLAFRYSPIIALRRSHSVPSSSIPRRWRHGQERKEGGRTDGRVSAARSPNSILDTFSFLSCLGIFGTFGRLTGRREEHEEHGSWQAYPCHMGYVDGWMAAVEARLKSGRERRRRIIRTEDEAALSLILGDF